MGLLNGFWMAASENRTNLGRLDVNVDDPMWFGSGHRSGASVEVGVWQFEVLLIAGSPVDSEDLFLPCRLCPEYWRGVKPQFASPPRHAHFPAGHNFCSAGVGRNQAHFPSPSSALYLSLRPWWNHGSSAVQNPHIALLHAQNCPIAATSPPSWISVDTFGSHFGGITLFSVYSLTWVPEFLPIQ